MKTYNCPFCNKKFVRNKKSLYSHIEIEHLEQLAENISPAQVVFNYRNKYNLDRGNGKCTVCRGNTKFNDTTEKYERMCSIKCKEAYRDSFKLKMKKKYGTEHLLNDMSKQKEMLANRKISGVFTWPNGYKTTYTGSYELKFLEFISRMWDNPEDIMMPAPQMFEYKHLSVNKIHIPDVYITSLNLIINIKSSENKHYRLRDIEIEKAQDKAIRSNKDYRYMKLMDNNFTDFLKFLENEKDKL